MIQAHWRSLLGNGIYRSRRDWFNRCVLVRVLMSLASCTLGLLLAYAYGAQAQAYTAGGMLMISMIISYNLLFAAFLAFGAGRNYERLCLKPDSCG